MFILLQVKFNRKAVETRPYFFLKNEKVVLG